MAGDATNKTFTFDTVAVLCAAILNGGGTITTKQYEMMSACDGKRTACSFQHEFRAVVKRGRELLDEMSANGGLRPVTAAPKRGRAATKTTPKSNARAGVKKEKVKKEKEVKKEDDEDDDAELDIDALMQEQLDKDLDALVGADDPEPSSKRIKVDPSSTDTPDE